jgi:type I restriction enzyme S subunit
LNGALLKALKIPASDRAQQSAIICRIKAALHEVDAMNASSKTTIDELKLLPQRLLAQAFEI